MIFNIVSTTSEMEFSKPNPTYDEISKFIKEQMKIQNFILSYLDDDGKQYYVNCQNDINEVRKKLSMMQKVNLYITLKQWTCGFCTYEENTDDNCEVCGKFKQQ